MPLPSFDPADYPQQLADKVARYKADFAAFDLPEPEVFASEPQAYRLRAEFRMWHTGDRVDYAMFDPADPKTAIVLDTFAPAAPPIAAAMPRLRDALIASEPLKRKLFQVDFLATLSGELMITLVYHRPLDEAWRPPRPGWRPSWACSSSGAAASRRSSSAATGCWRPSSSTAGSCATSSWRAASPSPTGR
jgi:tRNA (uracil-5-)-methyltransferase